MIEIIPKPITKKPFWLNILFYFSIFLLIGVIAGYFLLNHFLKKEEIILRDLEALLAKEKTPEEIALEKEILKYQKKIEDVGILLKEHRLTSPIFELLEKNTHPKVSYSNLDFNMAESQLRLKGIAEDFPTLGQQILLLEKDPQIKEVNLTEVLIGEGGKIVFTLYLFLDPQIFEF